LSNSDVEPSQHNGDKVSNIEQATPTKQPYHFAGVWIERRFCMASNNAARRTSLSRGISVMRKLSLSIIACALLSGAAFAADQTDSSPVAANAQPDATVVLNAGSVAAGIGYVWGHGNLTYNDQTHKFSISGVSVVDVGGANITATGSVYNLKTLSDFAGNYVSASAGLTVAGGGSATYLKNEHGVVIKLLATTVGMRFNLSAGGVSVKLKS
jgi:Envelope integrity protein A